VPRDAEADFDEVGRAYAERLKAVEVPPILPPGAPLISAREFIRRHHIEAGLRTLQHQNDSFFAWAGTHYAEIAKEDMRGRLYCFLDTALQPLEKGQTGPFNPTRAKVANVLEATAAVAQFTNWRAATGMVGQ
jgi:putative DNA primase/helicase